MQALFYALLVARPKPGLSKIEHDVKATMALLAREDHLHEGVTLSHQLQLSNFDSFKL